MHRNRKDVWTSSDLFPSSDPWVCTKIWIWSSHDIVCGRIEVQLSGGRSEDDLISQHSLFEPICLGGHYSLSIQTYHFRPPVVLTASSSVVKRY